MYGFSERSINNLIGVHPDMVRLMHAAIKDSPVDFTITEGVRTLEKQQEYFKKKVSNCDGIKHVSKHQIQEDGYSHAVDLYPYVNGSVRVNDVESLKKIGSHIKSVARQMGISIAWGGDWKMKDYPHFELA